MKVLRFLKLVTFTIISKIFTEICFLFAFIFFIMAFAGVMYSIGIGLVLLYGGTQYLAEYMVRHPTDWFGNVGMMGTLFSLGTFLTWFCIKNFYLFLTDCWKRV